MSKISILYAQPVIGANPENVICYYEGLAQELASEGNHVKLLNMLLLKDRGKLEKATQEQKEFAPDLIITFNNRISEAIIEATDCPIALCDADTVAFFSNKHLIKKYSERYFMISFYEGTSSDYEQLGFRKEGICTIKQATAVRKEAIEQNKNISFVGTRFGNYVRRIGEAIEKDQHRTIYQAIKYSLESNDYDYKSILNRFCPDSGLHLDDAYHLFDQRNFVLTSLLDLGLNLYGAEWHDLFDGNTALASAFDQTPLFSLKHNQDLYNSSKINISISHPQTRGIYYPWRVYDIMASNGLLISSRADLLTQQTLGEVAIPMFENPFDARELCKKYLREDNLRADVVAASNEYIEKNGRWRDNFIILEQFIGVPLTASSNNKGTNQSLVEIVKVKYVERSHKLNTFVWSSILAISTLPFAKGIIPASIKYRMYHYMRKLERFHKF